MIWRIIACWLLGTSLAHADLPRLGLTANNIIPAYDAINEQLKYQYDPAGNLIARTNRPHLCRSRPQREPNERLGAPTGSNLRRRGAREAVPRVVQCLNLESTKICGLLRRGAFRARSRKRR